MNKLLTVLCCSVAFLGATAANAAVDEQAAEAAAKKHKCGKCHLPNTRKTGGGPSVKKIASTSKGDKDAVSKLVSTVKAGGDKHPEVEAPEADIKMVVEWFLSKQ